MGKKKIMNLEERALIEEAGCAELVATFWEKLSNEERKKLTEMRAENRKQYRNYIQEVVRATGLVKREDGVTVAEKAAVTAWENVETPRDLVDMMTAAGELKKESQQVNVTFEDIVLTSQKNW